MPAVGGTPDRRTPIWAGHWTLDPTVHFLNHGSYGAVPDAVLRVQSELRARMEREAVRYFKVDLERLMDDMRVSLGAFVGCPWETIAPMPNATIAIATVLANTPLAAGDEVLITDHEYMSGVNELERVCVRTGARVVRAAVPFPVASPEQVTAAVSAAISPRTRLALISHITSATSLVFPIEEIIREIRARRGSACDILIDGAHAPGQVPVRVDGFDATYYVGSLHKWVSAPKGTAFLTVPVARQAGFRPVCLSSRAHKVRPERPLFLRDFDYMGTLDYSNILSVPAAIATMGSMLPGGWPALMAQNHELVMRGRRIVLEAMSEAGWGGLNGEGAAPESMIGTMATIILPEPPAEKLARPTLYDDTLQDELAHRHRCVVPVWRLASNNTRVLRISAQVYNTEDQYRTLAAALVEELRRERV